MASYRTLGDQRASTNGQTSKHPIELATTGEENSSATRKNTAGVSDKPAQEEYVSGSKLLFIMTSLCATMFLVALVGILPLLWTQTMTH